MPRSAESKANVATVRSLVNGSSSSLARMVVNMASPHVASFAFAGGSGSAYLNVYDLFRIGKRPTGPSATRLRVDAALPLPAGAKVEDVYFGAVELTGTGIRFYGDVCLVLRPEAIRDDTPILETNSYDLERSPLIEFLERPDVGGGRVPRTVVDARRAEIAKSMSGVWKNDLPAMAVAKMSDVLGQRTRRLTVGQVAEALRTDEDYVEVLKIGGFSADDIEEARVSAEDAALESLIGERLEAGPSPGAAELQWREDRKRAAAALDAVGIAVRTVTTSGRVKQ